MCAISGIIGGASYSVDELKLKEISDRMVLRGPDNGDYYIDKNIGLAHRRLSIIDLSTGDQPMKIAGGSIVIVYNGEVYNYQKIRDELIEKGCKFNSTSDTEVVVQAYQQYGIEGCPHQFLQHVLHGHDAVGTAELVQQDHQMGL